MLSKPSGMHQSMRNLRDGQSLCSFAIAIVKSHQTIGHVPVKFSTVCSLFLSHRGTIMCKVTGSRQHSQDLLQGGLESLYLDIWGGLEGHHQGWRNFLQIPPKAQVEAKGIPAEKRQFSGRVIKDKPSWKKTHNKYMGFEAESILSGAKLTDLCIHKAQQVLKWQFLHLNCLQPTILQAKKNLGVRKPLPNQLQSICTFSWRAIKHWLQRWQCECVRLCLQISS